MNNSELKDIAQKLIETTELAGNKSVELYKKGLKKIIKPDNSPVTNGDLEVNKILTEKIKRLTPNIPIVSEETVDLQKKNDLNLDFGLITDRPDGRIPAKAIHLDPWRGRNSTNQLRMLISALKVGNKGYTDEKHSAAHHKYIFFESE